LNITAVQNDIFWEDPKKNKDFLKRNLLNRPATDLIILPEMFTTGFSMEAKKLAEPYMGDSCNWMSEMAQKLDATLIGSIPTVDNEKFYNRLYVVDSSKVLYYDKRHLFTMAKEQLHYSPGASELIVKVKEFKIKPLICYDLRFPVWSRNKISESFYDYDLLIYVANWPSVRANAWVDLLKARAIENLSYVVGVNRVGIDYNEINYNGLSRVFGPKGERMDSFEEGNFCIQQLELSKKSLDDFRLKFPALNDADNFNLEY
jgi:predicted amidohydrolase